jgi:hypothetical protein
MLLFLDAVGASKKDLYEFGILLVLSPFIFAFLVVLLFRLLDRFSGKEDQQKQP